MAANGVDLDDQAAMDRWIAAYNAGRTRPATPEEDEDDEDVDLKEAFGLPDQIRRCGCGRGGTGRNGPGCPADGRLRGWPGGWGPAAR